MRSVTDDARCWVQLPARADGPPLGARPNLIPDAKGATPAMVNWNNVFNEAIRRVTDAERAISGGLEEWAVDGRHRPRLGSTASAYFAASTGGYPPRLRARARRALRDFPGDGGTDVDSRHCNWVAVRLPSQANRRAANLPGIARRARARRPQRCPGAAGIARLPKLRRARGWPALDADAVEPGVPGCRGRAGAAGDRAGAGRQARGCCCSTSRWMASRTADRRGTASRVAGRPTRNIATIMVEQHAHAGSWHGRRADSRLHRAELRRSRLGSR